MCCRTYENVSKNSKRLKMKTNSNHQELNTIMQRIKILNKANIEYIDEKKNEFIYKELWENLKQYGNAPDCVSVINDVVFPIEHFEIDSFEHTEFGGSSFRQESNKFLKKFFNIKKDIITELNANCKVEYLIKNFNNIFDKHYKTLICISKI